MPDATQRPRCHCTGCGGRKTRDAIPGWPARTGPAPLLYRSHGIEAPFDGLIPARWVDHAYRVRSDGGAWTYVAEPYSLDGPALADLAALIADGWNVTASAQRARHLPGATLAVLITGPARDGRR